MLPLKSFNNFMVKEKVFFYGEWNDSVHPYVLRLLMDDFLAILTTCMTCMATIVAATRTCS